MTRDAQTVLFSGPDPGLDQVEIDTLQFERSFWSAGLLVAGVDEAGRGCLAGPVVAAAVVMPPNLRLEGVTDSKTIARGKREELAAIIKERASCWAVASCNPGEIDSLNILWASMEAMRRAVEMLTRAPQHVLIDGNTRIPGLTVPSTTVVKGDARSHSISAASLLAKTHRDALMKDLHREHPGYGWDTNVGYPTAAHYKAIQKFGTTPHHRTSFRLF